MSLDEHNTNIVVVGLIERNGKIFIARRAATKTTFPNRFELPGGHVDPGETLEDALIREMREELELDITVGAVVDAFTYESEDMFKVEIVYLCKIKDDQEPVLHQDDHSEAKWIRSDEVGLMEKDDEETIALRKAFKLLEGEI